MAQIIISQLDSPCFLTQLDRIDITTQDVESFLFSVFKDGVEIFSNEYYPSKNKVTIYDLSKVVEPYLDFDELDRNVFILDVGLQLHTILVIPSSVAVDQDASSFVRDHFLSPVFGDRETCVGRREMLNLYDPVGLDAVVTAQYYSQGSGLSEKVFENTFVGFASLDVSPDQFVDESLGSLVAYTVQCDNRKARYIVRRSTPEISLAVMYLNSFGCWDTFYFTGEKVLAPKYTRSSASVDGNHCIYDIQEEVSWEVNTGVLRQNLIAAAADLARSKKVYALDANGHPKDEIAFTDTSITATLNDIEKLPDFKFTYRRVNKRSTLIEVPKRIRVFDNHFDDHFE